MHTGPQTTIVPGASRQRETRAPTAQASHSAWLAELFWQTGSTLFFSAASVICLAALLLMCGGSLSRSAATLILFAAFALTLILPWATFRPHWRIVSAAALGLAATSVIASLLIYDTSIDGQHYHFQAIYALTHGWNPYWSTDAPPALGEPASRWVTHYPMAAWLFDATLVGAGLPLETTKSLNFMALIASGLVVAGALGRLGLSWPRVAALTAAAALNPVTGAQLFTRMNDGLLASCILIFVVALVLWIAFDDRKAFWLTAVSMIIALNLKFSAVPVFALLCAAAVVGAFAFEGRRGAALKGWRFALSASLSLLAIGLAGLLLFGWSPYVLNFARFGHPFYPLMGVGARDIMAGNTPEVLAGMSRGGRFLFSLFSESHSGYEALPSLKLPLWTTLAEIRIASGPDVRIGGFGPLFSAVIVATGAAAALLIVTREKPPNLKWLLYVGGTLLLSVLIMPENWWARYVPQLWLVPWIAALIALLGKGRWLQRAGWAVAILMLANTLLVTGAATGLAMKRSQAVSEQLAALKRDAGPYCVTAGLAQSRVAIMREAGIDARAIPESAAFSCAEPIAIAGFGPDRQGGRICPCSGQ